MRRSLTPVAGTATGLLVLVLTARAELSVDSFGDPLPPGAVQRLGTLKMRYTSVGDLTYLPDGRAAVLVGGSVHIWDLAVGTLESSTSVSSAGLTSVERRRDGRALLLADGMGDVFEWDPEGKTVLRSWQTRQGRLCSARYSPDGKRLLVAGNSPLGYIEYDLESGAELNAGGVEFAETRCGAIYGPDGETVIMGGGYDHLLEHRVLATGELRKRWASNYEAKQIRLSPDRSTILVGVESCAEEYRLSDYSLLHRYDPVAGEAGRCFAHDFAATRNEAVLGLRTGSIHRYDRATGREVLRWSAHSGLISALAVSPDEKRVLTFGGGLLVESDLDTGLARLPWPRHGGPVQAVVFTPCGDRIISGSRDGTLRVWDSPSGRSRMRIEGATLGAYALAVSPDGTRVAAGCQDGAIREFSLADGNLLRQREGHRGIVRSIAYTRDGNRLVSSADDGSIRIWPQASRDAIVVLQGHLGGVLSVAVSADGHRLLSGGRDGTVRLWDAVKAAELAQHRRHRGWVEAVAFAGDGRWAVSTGGDGKVMRWDLETGQVDLEWDNGGPTLALAVSPGGQIVYCGVSSGANGWLLASGRQVAGFRGHQGSVHALATSPEGGLIVTGSTDTSLLVWTVPAPE